MGVITRGVKNSEKAFQKVESKLPFMKGRKFYGLLYGKPDDGEYFACVEVKSGDNPQAVGLEKREIPGGWYARKKIRYWYEDLKLIGKGFEELFESHSIDTNRPTIEYYRSERDLHIFVPIER